MIKLVKILSYLIAVILLTNPAAGAARTKKNAGISGRTPENEKLLEKLDSLLSNSGRFVAQKEERIKRLRDNYIFNSTSERRYWSASELYDEYSAYDSDSALAYADRAIDFATRLGRKDLSDEMQLNKSYVYSATGLFAHADKCLAKINPDSLPAQLAIKYCDRVLFLSTHQDQYIGVQYETGVFSQKVDSLLQGMSRSITPDNPQYCWLIGWSSLNDREKARKAIPLVSKVVDGTDYSTRSHAMDAWVLSKLYEQAGDEENHFKYLVLSAIADVRACNKEIASLEELAQILYDSGDLDRANSYINHCIAYANEYKSRVRLGKLARLQEQILGAIQERHVRQAKANHWYLAVLIVILCILVGAFFFIMRQNRLLQKSRQTLNDANGELSRKVEELQTIREELNTANGKLSEMYKTEAGYSRRLAEVNDEKESCIASLFAICSNYINKLEDFRTDISRLLANRQFEKAMSMVKSPELSYAEVKQLHASFDEIFLQIYPDFVKDFNSLLRPEERIELKNPSRLNTELRIYALVRLGMNDSVSIAKFLHCSVQTVYNTRHRTRNKGIVPTEDFAQAVMDLGKRKTV